MVRDAIGGGGPDSDTAETRRTRSPFRGGSSLPTGGSTTLITLHHTSGLFTRPIDGGGGTRVSWTMLRIAWTHEEFAAALDATDLWRDPDDGTRKAARSQVAGGVYPFNFDLLDSWVVFAGGETLAEGGVEEFLNELGSIVARAGVHLQVRRLIDPYGEMQADRYVVEINGESCLIWRAEDWAYENVWAQATVRPLARVNELLAAAGSAKRMFTLYSGGNEGLAYLLDPEVVAAVRASGLIDGRETPDLAMTD
jgi:hypothetical protein